MQGTNAETSTALMSGGKVIDISENISSNEMESDKSKQYEGAQTVFPILERRSSSISSSSDSSSNAGKLI